MKLETTLPYLERRRPMGESQTPQPEPQPDDEPDDNGGEEEDAGEKESE